MASDSNDSWIPRRVVVGIDETGGSDPAVALAGVLAERFGTRVDLVHAVPTEPIERGTGRAAEQARKVALHEAADVREVKAHLQVSIEAPVLAERPLEELLHVGVGDPDDVLVEYAREHGADLILLGPHRRRGLLDMGATVRGVLSKSPCPVWMQPVDPVPIHRILVPVENDPSSQVILRLAAALARALDAEITALHCMEPPELAYGAPGPTYVVDEVRDSERKAFGALLDGVPELQGLEGDRLFVEGYPAQRILDALERFDLCIMGTHARGTLSSALLGSQAKRVLKKAKRPAVAVPLREETAKLLA